MFWTAPHIMEPMGPKVVPMGPQMEPMVAEVMPMGPKMTPMGPQMMPLGPKVSADGLAGASQRGQVELGCFTGQVAQSDGRVFKN